MRLIHNFKCCAAVRSGAHGQCPTIADFYRGKIIAMICGIGVGSGG
jgi:hypothetical protein